MGGQYKNIDGEMFGNYKIIGDTGKRTSKGAIVIARNIETGEIYEGPSQLFRSGEITGYRKSEKIKSNIQKLNKSRVKNGIHDSYFRNSIRTNNKTGYKNVFYSENHKKWRISINFKNKKHTKTFADFKDAILYVNEFYLININPFIDNEDKIEKISEHEIIINDYVLEKQKLINQKGEF